MFTLIHDTSFRLQIWELLTFFGHGNLPQTELAGLLSECGYTGRDLQAILEKAQADPRGQPSIFHRNPTIRRMVPESNSGCCLACTICTICVVGPIICLGGFALRPPEIHAQQELQNNGAL